MWDLILGYLIFFDIDNSKHESYKVYQLYGIHNQELLLDKRFVVAAVFCSANILLQTNHTLMPTLRKMFGWINQSLVGSTIEYGYYTYNQIFGWPNKIFWLVKFGWSYQLFSMIQPNTMVNLGKRFCSSK